MSVAGRVSVAVLFIVLLACPAAWGADERLVHLDWRAGSSLVGLHGVGHEVLNEVRFSFEVGPCHRDLLLDLLYEPASGGHPDGSDPRIPYVIHAAIYDADGALFSERSISRSGYGHRMGTLPTAGTYEVMVRLDVGAAVDWDVRVRGWKVYDEPTCELFLNEVDLNPAGSDSGSEWIEIYNQGDVELDLGGWQIWGASWRSHVAPEAFTIPSGTTIAPGAHLLIPLDDGEFFDDVNETVILADPGGRLLDLTPATTDRDDDARSWSRAGDGAASWDFGSATPGATNDT